MPPEQPQGIDAIKALVMNCDQMAMQMMMIENDLRGPADDWPSRDELIALMGAVRRLSQDMATTFKFLLNGIEQIA